MKYPYLLLTLTSLISLAAGHYKWSWLSYNDTSFPEWEYVRPWINYTNAYQEGLIGGSYPIYNVSSLDIRCNVGASTNTSATLAVEAGTNLTFHVDPFFYALYHPGPAMVYLAKVPEGETAATWDGSGEVWFKIYETIETVDTEGYYAGEYNWYGSWPYMAPNITAALSSSLPSGEYLFRVEHLAIHQAYMLNGAQFYISCGGLDVQNGGSGTPGPLVAFPGAYSPTDPGILYNINSDYNPATNPYINPGPPIWHGV